MSRDEDDAPPELDLPADEEQVSEAELAEARALARALERRAAPSEWNAAPEREVESAALLRVSRAMTLDRGRQADILQEVLAGRERALTTSRGRRAHSSRGSRRWWWMLPLPVAALAAVVLFRQSRTEHAQVAALTEAPVARPDVELLEAQARWIASSGAHAPAEADVRTTRVEERAEPLALADYDAAMSRYRTRFLHSLDDHYRR